ncbi:hypothetical protein GQ53DRAFT_707900 [Thozetella sp. PMI_491]|nr:hypothetical protein GQ53DRAFT_707900 [Thozetella sp. PMI_491]
MDRRTESRQLPGNACEECRKKKLRCDRRRPKCGACLNAQVPCRVNERRAPRGNKRENINNLYHRIAELECLQASTQPRDVTEIEIGRQEFDLADCTAMDGQLPDPFISLVPDLGVGEQPSPTLIHTDRRDSGFDPRDLSFCTPSLSFPHDPILDALPSELVRADLLQLYIDRVHCMMPMLSLAKLVSWSNDSRVVSERQECLQYAVFTAATAFSSQFGNIQEAIYAKTRSMLERIDMETSDSGPYPIELIQSWILLAFYEFAKTNYRRAWLNAGRVFRLVQFTKLHNLDSHVSKGPETNEDPVSLEERRRTFWVAFYLDRLASLGEGASMALNEDSVFTRLPCQDTDIHNSATQEPFLDEAMPLASPRHYSSLAECAILANICARILSHKQIMSLGSVYGSTSALNHGASHDWLDTIVTRRLQSLQARCPSTVLGMDPMNVLCHMLAHSAIIYMCESIETTPGKEQNQAIIRQFQERALAAAKDITRLASDHQQFGCFRSHTFMPLPIYLAASRLGKHLEIRATELKPEDVDSIEESRRACLDVLQKLKPVNHLAAHYYYLLELE